MSRLDELIAEWEAEVEAEAVAFMGATECLPVKRATERVHW